MTTLLYSTLLNSTVLCCLSFAVLRQQFPLPAVYTDIPQVRQMRGDDLFYVSVVCPPKTSPNPRRKRVGRGHPTDAWAPKWLANIQEVEQLESGDALDIHTSHLPIFSTIP